MLKEKLENFLNSKYFVPLIIILIAITAFCLGRISGLQERREPVRVTTSPLNPSPKLGEGNSAITNEGEVKGASIDSTNPTQAGAVVASKNGTKYHYPWCAGAKQISPKNLVSFDSIEAARAAGYTPASNCKGLK